MCLLCVSTQAAENIWRKTLRLSDLDWAINVTCFNHSVETVPVTFTKYLPFTYANVLFTVFCLTTSQNHSAYSSDHPLCLNTPSSGSHDTTRSGFPPSSLTLLFFLYHSAPPPGLQVWECPGTRPRSPLSPPSATSSNLFIPRL